MGKPTVSYRIAKLDDLAVIVDIEYKCFNKHDVFPPRALRRMLENPQQSIISDVILYKGNPAGWASYFTRKNSDVIRIYSICVLPEYKGLGIATEYLSQRMATFTSYKFISLEVRESNAPAIRLYEKLGFETYEKLISYYPDGEDGLKMRKLL